MCLASMLNMAIAGKVPDPLFFCKPHSVLSGILWTFDSAGIAKLLASRDFEIWSLNCKGLSFTWGSGMISVSGLGPNHKAFWPSKTCIWSFAICCASNFPESKESYLSLVFVLAVHLPSMQLLALYCQAADSMSCHYITPTPLNICLWSYSTYYSYCGNAAGQKGLNSSSAAGGDAKAAICGKWLHPVRSQSHPSFQKWMIYGTAVCYH